MGGRVERTRTEMHVLEKLPGWRDLDAVRSGRVILGDGKPKAVKALRTLAQELGIADRVELLGHTRNPYKFMRRSDCFALASLWEGFGIVLAPWLNQWRIPGTGFKLGFWFAQQGAIYVFVALIFIYVVLMNRLDRACGVDEREDES